MRAHPDQKVWSIHALRSDIQTRAELDETERGFIQFLKAQDPEYGYNICRGGEGFTGPHTVKTRLKMSLSKKGQWSNPGFRIKQSEAVKASWSDEKRFKQADISKERWSHPEFKNRLSKIQQEAQTRIEVVTKKSEIGKKIWSDSDRLAERGRKIREALSKPEERIRRGKATKTRWADPNYRASMVKLAKALWSDPAYCAKMDKRRQKTSNTLQEEIVCVPKS